jgi:hypothetical protein
MTSRRIFALLLAALAAASSAPARADMVQYQWKKRPLVVFAPSDQHPGFVRQKTIVGGNRTALADRDMVVVYVAGGSVSTDLGAPPGMSAAALRSMYRASEGAFRVLLIGKDGGIKIDSPTPLAATDLTAEIDRMPMRRDEVKRRSEQR